MYPHRIRLRGPWECEPLQRSGDDSEPLLPPPRRMTMPCHWSEGGLGDFSGRVRFRRAFGYPGRIDAHERVWLTFAGVADEAEVHLNNTPLGRIAGAAEFDVTRLLRRRNEMVLDVEGTAEQGGLWGEVRLEVRCSAFLRDLRPSAILTGDRATLRVSGQVVGEAERPLEVYVLLDRSVVGYQVLSATPPGQSFEIVAPDLPATHWRGPEGQTQPARVQVDLVNGAVVWHTSVVEVMLEKLTDPSK
jgi:hypothetical protein